MDNIEPQINQAIDEHIKNATQMQYEQKQQHYMTQFNMIMMSLTEMFNRQQYYSQGFRQVETQNRQQMEGYGDANVKIQQMQDDGKFYNDHEGRILVDQKKSERTNKTSQTKGPKIKKMKKNNVRNTQKNLLVHLKLWLQKFIQQKGKIQPFIRKQFDRIFTNGSNKSSRDVYMNLYLLQRVLQHQSLRPCLKQFFQRRILRYLMNSNIQNKMCIIKYLPILLKKYTQGHCKSLKP